MARHLITLILASILASACTLHKKEEDVSGPMRVQIPFAVDGKYSLQIVELITLENLVALKGLAARFMIDPDTNSGQLQGRDPEIKYIRDEDGVIVAKDALSLQLLTVYAHFEKMRDLDQKLGVVKDVVWPAKVAVNARYKTEEGTLVNNALYSGQYDALLMVPYTGQDLPIMVNAGVLGHEHFHNIFQKMVINPLDKKYPGAQATSHGEKKMLKVMGIDGDGTETVDPEELSVREKYHEVFLRALNEGFADVWGWVYSGDNDFVGKSLPEEKMRRQIDLDVMGLSSVNEIRGLIDQGMTTQSLLGYSYALGTQYARAIRNYGAFRAETENLNSEQTRLEMGAYLLRILPELEKKFASLKDSEYLSPGDIVEIFLNQAQSMKSRECFFFAKLVSASERKESTETRCRGLEASENNQIGMINK